MNGLKDALENYLLCSSQMNAGKEFLIEFMTQKKFSSSCIEGVLVYLKDLHKSGFDINEMVNSSFDSIIDFQPCSQTPCSCLNLLKLEELLSVRNA